MSSFVSVPQAKVSYTKTIVYNNGSAGANSLQQFYDADRDRVTGINVYSHKSSIIYSPKMPLRIPIPLMILHLGMILVNSLLF